MSAQPLSDPRCVVTAINQKGASVFESDENVTIFRPFGPGVSGFANFHNQTSVPVNNMVTAPQLGQSIPRTPPGGVLFCMTDIPPHFTVPMHRTLSVDYIIVVSGSITLKLDGGDEEKTVGAGEFMVQQGTNHTWLNKTDEWCRMAVVCVSAEKPVLDDGTVLDEIKPKPPGK